MHAEKIEEENQNKSIFDKARLVLSEMEKSKPRSRDNGDDTIDLMYYAKSRFSYPEEKIIAKILTHSTDMLDKDSEKDKRRYEAVSDPHRDPPAYKIRL